jgi:hypothetical protein
MDTTLFDQPIGLGFTVQVPQTGEFANRNRVPWSFIGFMNAYMLTGNDKYVEAWRKAVMPSISLMRSNVTVRLSR